MACSIAYQGAFLLSPSDIPALSSFLQRKGWLRRGEVVQQAECAGEGNMNCVVRVHTDKRSFILKQSRPWVEKYPQIPAPWDRALVEARFYEEAKKNPEISAHVPELLEFDPKECMLMLEDLGPARDLSGFYQFPEEWMRESDLSVLAHFLVTLHTSFRDPALSAVFSNHAMRQLNHEHIFSLPLQQHNGLNLDAITPGLTHLAEQLQSHSDYVATVTELGRLYLDTPHKGCLLHGDFFPGSWMKVREQLYVIDPEFCFYGPPEWDMGVMAAHLFLAGQPAKLIRVIPERYSADAPLDKQLMWQFAGTEIMRRLIGVAQLPLPYGFDCKRQLLQISLDLVLSGSIA